MTLLIDRDNEEGGRVGWARLDTGASKRSIRRFVITEKAPTRAFSWLKAATTAFTLKTLSETGIDPTVSQREIGSAATPCPK